jgi:hypothetical protein
MADLISWYSKGNEFTGYIFGSSDTLTYPDNKPIRIQFERVDHYPALKHQWDEHWIGKTVSGVYFKMELKHQLKVRSR